MSAYFEPGGCVCVADAGVMRISPSTVQREWRMARAWLQRELDVDATG